MGTLVDLSSRHGHLHIISSPAAIDCSKELGFRRTFRSLVELMAPCCGLQAAHSSTDSSSSYVSTLTGTFFGTRHGRVRFCLHVNTRNHPLLSLELSLPTAYLAREMQSGLLRIALQGPRSSGSLFAVPIWTMYCNGRRMGFAVRRQMSERETSALKTMQSVSTGAGVLPGEGKIMFLRASFERVIGSADTESFHLINPAGCSGQQLSIFLLRS